MKTTDDATLTLAVVAAVDTAQPHRDAHLPSVDFFAVDVHPTFEFVSRAV